MPRDRVKHLPNVVRYARRPQRTTRLRPVCVVAVGLAVAMLAACQRSSQDAVRAAPPMPVASIQELMDQQIDPAADTLWGAVSETLDEAGIHETAPQTDQEWVTLRRAALQLAESPNLLVIRGRPVAAHGGRAADEGSPGVLTTLQIQAAIAANPDSLNAAAAGLQRAAIHMLAAIDARDPARVSGAGEELDAACESCHLQFWYPPGQTPAVAAQVYGKPHGARPAV